MINPQDKQRVRGAAFDVAERLNAEMGAFVAANRTDIGAIAEHAVSRMIGTAIHFEAMATTLAKMGRPIPPDVLESIWALARGSCEITVRMEPRSGAPA